VPPSIRGSL
jgi:hypothetical protein